jgi:iron complex outermembrane receptor protein
MEKRAPQRVPANRETRMTRFTLKATAAIVAITASSAFAQGTAPGGAAAGSSASSEISEIVVTARKREERLQTVPLAITAVTGAQLDQKGVLNTVSLSGQVPNLFLKQNPTTTVSSSIYIRGIGQEESHFTQEPGVGLYIDGVFYSRASGSITELVEVDRIEVLRGPQGTLFGRNSPAGAISIVTRAPDLSQDGGRLEGTFGSYSQVTVKGTGNVVLIPGVLAAKIDFLSRNQDGYMKNGFVRPGIKEEKFSGISKAAVRVSTLYQPNEKLRLRLTGDYSRDRSDMYAPTFVSADARGVVSYLNGDPFVSYVRPEFGLPAKFNGYSVSLTADYDINDSFAFKNITAYRDYYHFLAGELFGAQAFPLGLQRTQRGTMMQQEWQLNYSTERFQSVAGLIYYRDVAKEEAWNDFAGGANSYPVSRQTTNSYAVYAEGTYDFTDWASLTLGARQSWDDKSLRRKSTNLPNLAGRLVAFDMNDSRSNNAFTPRVILDFKPLEAMGSTGGAFLSDLLVYASWSKGYKTGVFSPGFTDNNTTARTFLQPEKVTTYEGGFKSDLFERRARFNLTYFYTDYTNLQQRDCAFATAAGCRPLGLDVTLQGVEIEGSARLTDELSINGTVATLSAKYNRPFPGSTRLPNTPKLTYQIGADYRTDLAFGGSLFAGVQWRWTDDFEQVFASAPQTRTKAYGLLSAQIGYESEDGRWTVKLSGENLGDKFYIANAIGGGNLGSQWIGRPREIMATIGFKY